MTSVIAVSKTGQSIYCVITLAKLNFNRDECYHCLHIDSSTSLLRGLWAIITGQTLCKSNEHILSEDVCNCKLTGSVFLRRLQSPPQPTPFRRGPVGLGVVMKMMVIIRRTVRATAPVAQLSPDWLVHAVCVAFLIHHWFQCTAHDSGKVVEASLKTQTRAGYVALSR